MTLLAECAAPDAALEAAVAATLQAVTKLKGTVKLVAPARCRTTARSSPTSAPAG